MHKRSGNVFINIYAVARYMYLLLIIILHYPIKVSIFWFKIFFICYLNRFSTLSIHIWNRKSYKPVQYQWSFGSACSPAQYHTERSAIHRGWNQHWRGSYPCAPFKKKM